MANEVHSITDLLRVYAMPVITLTFVISAQMIRMTRAAVIETLYTPYVEMALLKGASRERMVLKHALPNALGPIVNAVALSLSYLFGGVIIVETIFNYPGIAKLMVDAVATRDLPLIQTCAMIFCLGYLLLITLADIRRHHVQPEAAMTIDTATNAGRVLLGYSFNLVGIAGALRHSGSGDLSPSCAASLIPYPVGDIVDVDYFGPMRRSSGSAPTIWAATCSRAF